MPNRNNQPAIAILLLSATGCIAPPSPSPSSVERLEIRGTTLMMVGGRGQLSAWRNDGGQPHEVTAQWTADGDVISINGSGGVIARRLGKASVRAQYRDVIGTETVHVVTSVAGIWGGAVTLVDCWQSIVPEPCTAPPSAAAAMSLTISQSAAAELANITGTMSVFSPAATGSVVGLLDSEGTFFVQGHIERSQDHLQGGVSLRWRLENGQLVPLIVNDQSTDDLLLNMTGSSGPVSFTQVWKIGPLSR